MKDLKKFLTYRFALLQVRRSFTATRDALPLMLNLPLVLIGGVAGVYIIHGAPSVATFLGLITLFGVATRNCAVLNARARNVTNVNGAKGPPQAGIHSKTEPLVPMLMSALSAGLAFVPLPLAGGEPGSEIQAPMAMVILFGLLSLALLKMVVVPSPCLRFGSVARAYERKAASAKTLLPAP